MPEENHFWHYINTVSKETSAESVSEPNKDIISQIESIHWALIKINRNKLTLHTLGGVAEQGSW